MTSRRVGFGGGNGRCGADKGAIPFSGAACVEQGRQILMRTFANRFGAPPQKGLQKIEKHKPYKSPIDQTTSPTSRNISCLLL